MATSELHQFLENVDEKVLECTICFKRLKNPKSLNCLHTFCLACLEVWVRKEKGKLTCPTCSKSYPIPDGGLQKLPPNTILNNLLETIEQFSETNQMKCICGKRQAKYYCQECRHYLCYTCRDHHKILPISAHHKLYSMEDVRSMTPLQIASLHPPQCSLHNEPLKFFCSICKIPICMHCTITDHNAWEGNHKPISISKAFQTFKETSKKLEKAANDCKNKLKDGLKAVTQIAANLEQNKLSCLRDIDNHVRVMVKKIKENSDQIKNEVETIYKKKKKVLDAQMDELKTKINDINTKLSFLNQLLKSDEATAMQSCEKIVTALKDRTNELPKAKPNDNGQIKFFKNKQQITSLQCDIGHVSHMKAADCLTLKGEEYVTPDQIIVVKIIKTDVCKIHTNQLKAIWTQPTGETSITQVQEDDNGEYFVTLSKCTSLCVYKLDVSVDGEPIKQSPFVIKVQKEGLVNTIQINQVICDLVKCEDDCLLVSDVGNEIQKFNLSGEYIGKITLPKGVSVYRMYKMKNGNIAFSDYNACIRVCNMNGQVIKSIGHGVLKYPQGTYVDEASNLMYAADWCIDYVYMFNFDSGKMIKKIGSKGYEKGQMNLVCDMTLTKQGHILVLDSNKLQLFHKSGMFMKVLVKEGDKNGELRDPRGVVVDEDDNIIISSHHKLQLFSSDGNFIKRIDEEKDGINSPWGLSIISYHPRRVAVVNDVIPNRHERQNIKIFNY